MSIATINTNKTIIFGLDQDVYRWLDSMSAQPSSTFVYNLNNMISKLKAAAVWDQLDRFWLFATEDRQHAQICLKSLSAITEVSSPLWTTNQGFSGNGSSSYINSNFIISTQASNYTQNNCSYGVYSRTNVAASYIDIGSLESVRNYFYIRRADLVDRLVATSNTATDNAAVGITVTDSRGLFSIQRTTSSSFLSLKNGSSLGSSTISTNGIPSIAAFILSLNNGGTPGVFSARQLSMAYFGSGNINQLKFYNIFQEFATRQGFNV